MVIAISDGWQILCIALAIAAGALLVMGWLSRYFVTKDPAISYFTIFDLQLAATEKEIENTLTGIVPLKDYRARIKGALKKHIAVDFLFMPALCGSLFILCMEIAGKMPLVGAIFFSALAWLQVAVWLSGVYENIYLLRKIRLFAADTLPLNKSRNLLPAKKSAGFRWFQVAHIVKWIFSLLALVCCVSSLLFFWLTGAYAKPLLNYLLIFVLIIIVFLLIKKALVKGGKLWRTQIH